MAGHFQDFLDRLPSVLAGLSADRQCAFGAACCERHFPHYLRFVEQEHWGNSASLRATIDAAWKVIHGEQVTTSGFAASCEKAMPDTEDFTSKRSSFALNAAAMAAYLANFLETRRAKDIFWIASLGRDTADVAAAEELWLPYTAITPEIEKGIEASSFMKDELEAQRDFLTIVQASELNIDRLILRARSVPCD